MQCENRMHFLYFAQTTAPPRVQCIVGVSRLEKIIGSLKISLCIQHCPYDGFKKLFDVRLSFDDGEETQMGFHILIYPLKLLKVV